MNKEELIRYGKDYLRDLTTSCCEISDIHKEFVREAIKALEQQPSKDCVSRQKLLKYNTICVDDKGLNRFCVPTQVVKELPSVIPTQRWIPCSEELPKIHNYSKKYLVTLKNGTVCDAIFTECEGEHWWNYNYDDVVAWQELPKPYKAESNTP